MKVIRSMMNKDVRGFGSIIRITYKFRKKSQFERCNKLLNRFMKGKFPKKFNVEEKYILREDKTKLRILICYPKRNIENATGVLWIHGGGYALGLPEQEFGYVKNILDNINSVVVLPDYTLSLEKPYPSALEDCYTTLKWMKENYSKININKDQIFVAGESAGGGLTAALCLYARDKKEVNIAFQMPLYPMLDDRMETESMKDNDAPVWDYEANKLGWKLYLGDLFQKDDVSYYASPSRARNYSNLPPAYTFVGSIEPFYDETINYINNLKKAGINAKIDVYEGCFHAFDLLASKKKISKEATKKWVNEIKYASKNYYSKN